VLFHYALVDDLISKEEFERRVEAKIEECGDLIDEPAAAMLVIGELGRKHVKIKGLQGKSSLFSFFGKVIDRTEPREFARADGEKGHVATLLLGDETGTCRVLLWDEKAGAAGDIAKDDVLEIIGRHSGKNANEITALALRKASCDITCAILPDKSKESLSFEPVTLDAVLISVEGARTFSRKDGTTGEMVEAIIGDDQGTARVVAWAPGLLAGILPGTTLTIANARPDMRGEGRAYSLDDKSSVSTSTKVISVPLTPPGSVGEQGIYSVQGMVKEVKEPRSFVSRNGSASWVRNIVVTDGTDDLRLVLWGEKALIPLRSGDRIEAYHATARPGRYGGIELGVGKSSALRLPEGAACPIVFQGTVIAGSGCTFIDNGVDRYLMDSTFPHGTEVRVSGMLSGSRIMPEHEETVEMTSEEVMAHLRRFRDAAKR
jgi:replication factor A1